MRRLLDYARYECKSGANRDKADLSHGRAGSLPATQRTLRQIALSTERCLEIGPSVPSSGLPQFSYILDLLGAPLRYERHAMRTPGAFRLSVLLHGESVLLHGEDVP
jgi:hypothetical protein